MNGWMLFFSGLVATLVALRIIAYLTMKASMKSRPSSVREEDLTLEETAFLMGGPDRAMQTWWVRLRELGAIADAGTLRSGLRMYRASPDAEVPADLADAYTDISKLSRGPHRATEFYKQWSARVSEIERGLSMRGVLNDASKFERASFVSFALSMGVIIGGLAIWGMGLLDAWAYVGALLGAVINLIVTGYVLRTTLGYGGIFPTRHGLALREQIKLSHAAATRAPSRENMGWAVGVAGLTVLTATPFEAYGHPAYHNKAMPGTAASGGCSGPVIVAYGAGDGASADAWSASGGFSTGGTFGGDSGFSSGGSDSGSGGSGCSSGSSGCGGGGCGGS